LMNVYWMNQDTYQKYKAEFDEYISIMQRLRNA